MATRLQKIEREQLDVVVRELALHGIVGFRLVGKRKHVQVRWDGGSVAISSSPSDSKVFTAIRASVRKQCR